MARLSSPDLEIRRPLLPLILFAALPVQAEPLPMLRSESVLVRDVDSGEILVAKAADEVRPIASVTKLLSGLLLASMPPVQSATVTLLEADKDRLKWSRSRLRVGRRFVADELLGAALAASDNRAMYAAVRARGLERAAFVERMNGLAAELGMKRSRFADPAGVDPANVSTARDLLLLLDAAARSERVRRLSLSSTVTLRAVDAGDQDLVLANPNRLARSPRWSLVVGKTGYTVEAGRALVVRAHLAERLVDMVFLGSREMASVFGDAGRIRQWLLARPPRSVFRPATAAP